ncbi:DUF6314 family protein [Rickettsia endosymbiont of Cardiosporidium cionae]|uniref:DUF6314 family protein n=1 Tax=Rickettsia endosymbiont of Cardiosporidium cionae TaxID=2777155 RepID=UPI00189423E5|nr:DUF6314 family protein [Rickettsia endosymbiont of Cardiosporidium cionae]KAF8818649.1 hypothetical protein IHI24_000371 [Rickettsia endosymbiont of Cardiosporidium cionae]
MYKNRNKECVNKILEKFLGNWKILKNITNKSDVRCIYKGSGGASFKILQNTPNTMLYEEKLLLKNDLIKSSNIIAYQKYLYKYNQQNTIISKYLSDNSFLCNIFMVNNRANGKYICNKDTYSFKYDFSLNYLCITYNIEGPSKNFLIHNHYLKLS